MDGVWDYYIRKIGHDADFIIILNFTETSAVYEILLEGKNNLHFMAFTETNLPS